MRRLFWLVVLAAFPLLTVAADGYRVLILHSYHAGLAWTDDVQRGLDASIRESGLEVNVHVEYMDALRFRSKLAGLKNDLKRSLRTKFDGNPPDVVVVSDNEAFDFMLAERDFLAPGVPLVFCGINGLSGYPLSRFRQITGVAEAASFGDTLEVIDRLFPGRRILVVGDQSSTFRGNLDGLRQANQKRAHPAALEVFDDPVLSHIESHLRHLGSDTAVFFMARPIDEERKTVAMTSAVRAVSLASPQPVFSGWDFMLGHGIVGGRLVSGEAHGREAGRQLTSILRGVSVDSLPIIWESPNRYLFDYRQLQRFGLQNAALPADATVIGRPVGFYEANRDKVHATMLAFAILLIIVAALIVEVVRRRRAEVQLGYLATHDILTGLTNRALLDDRFQQAMALATRNKRALAILFLDLDHFKEINDSLGHGMGDKLLREVATRLRTQVRDSDTLCRLGGDEFVILLNQLDQGHEAASMAEKILDAMQAPFELPDHALTVSFSIGISTYPVDGQDFESLLKNADIAMYQAKRSGRNAYHFFDDRMNVEIQRRSALHQHLAGAHLRGEMALHIQPQRSLSDGSIVGAEALLRWRSPELGSVSPAEFIPVAESSGLIIPLGAWVFEEACRIVASWQGAGYPAIPLAVNVSVAQLRRPDFHTFVRATLDRHAVAPTRIEVEITESVFMENVPAIDANLKALEVMGILLAIDDFGTGYSNLAYLKQTAAGRLKIDRSFVKDIVANKNDSAIVRAIIQIGRSLGMKTIAEGVEEQAQADFLTALGCDSMQGYLLSRPVPAEDFKVFFEQHRARHQLTAVDLVCPSERGMEELAQENKRFPAST